MWCVGVDGDDVVAVRSTPPGDGPRNHACSPLADRSARGPGREVIGSRSAFDTALDEWKTLTAAALVGIAATALEMGVEYVLARHQFGVPVGSFQAVQHGLADLPALIDGSRLLTHKAAWAADRPEPGVCDVGDNDITDPTRAGVDGLCLLRRCRHSGDRSQPALSRRLRLLRRVRHPALLPPGPGLVTGLRRPRSASACGWPIACSARSRRADMEFSLPPDVEDYRLEIKELVARHVTPEVIDRQHRTGTFNSPELNRALAERGFLERAVPGLGKGDPIELWVLFNELEKAGAPYDGISVAVMVAGVVNHTGTEWQKKQVLPSILAGEALVCMGYSEPDYGSDLASITTKAERDGDEWVINGAKMWTTMAHVAKWLILLTRSDPTLPKHKGLTMFILPMDTPGISVEPVYTMGTEHTNATFYDNVRVGQRMGARRGQRWVADHGGGPRLRARRHGRHQSGRAPPPPF